jgi:hypothetical protein
LKAQKRDEYPRNESSREFKQSRKTKRFAELSIALEVNPGEEAEDDNEDEDEYFLESSPRFGSFRHRGPPHRDSISKYDYLGVARGKGITPSYPSFDLSQNIDYVLRRLASKSTTLSRI